MTTISFTTLCWIKVNHYINNGNNLTYNNNNYSLVGYDFYVYIYAVYYQ